MEELKISNWFSAFYCDPKDVAITGKIAPEDALAVFEKTLSARTHSNMTPQELYAQIEASLPAELSLDDAVNKWLVKIGYYDKDFLLSIPSEEREAKLSPYNQVRMAIFHDRSHTLTTNGMLKLLQAKVPEATPSQVAGCYDLAYRTNHPYILPYSDEVVTPTDYTINLLWINLNPQDRIKNIAKNIFGKGLNGLENSSHIIEGTVEESLDRDQIKQTFTYRVSQWATVNTGTTINVWCDTALITQKAWDNTAKMFQGIQEATGAHVQLRGIRTLPRLQEEEEIRNMYHPGSQVYARVDEAKALIADHMISSPKETAKYCVVTDADVEAMGARALFDQRTQAYLSTSGYVFNRVGVGNFENNFFIFQKGNKKLREWHAEALIHDVCHDLTGLRPYCWGSELQSQYLFGAQAVFRHYGDLKKCMKEARFSYRETFTRDPKGSRLFPRKVVQSPPSQFNMGGKFRREDFKSETFRFIGESNVPYTRNGRACPSLNERQLPHLINWTPEPLTT